MAASSCVTSTTARPSSHGQEPEHRRAGLGVEVARRLVGEHERGIVDEGARDRQALLLAAGELVRQAPGHRREAEALDERAAAARRAGRRPRQPRGQQDVLLARELRHEVEELEHEADAPATQEGELAPGRPTTRSPTTSMAPASGRSSAPRTCRSVDLPEPEPHHRQLAGAGREVRAV